MAISKITFFIDDYTGYFEFPEDSDYTPDELFDAMELISVQKYEEAESLLRKIIVDTPDNIDALAHLAMIMSQTNRSIEARAILEQAVNIGRDCIPNDFKLGMHTMPYGVLENRPYLRAHLALALAYYESGDIHGAAISLREHLDLNPNDNLGAREVAVECYLHLEDYQQVLKICKKYPEDTMPGIVWGRVLAYHSSNQITKAITALREAQKLAPLAGKNLLKKMCEKPPKSDGFGYTHGGDEQAFDFWKRYRKFWEQSEGALEFLKKYMTKCGFKPSASK